jgi:hypothetical protein
MVFAAMCIAGAVAIFQYRHFVDAERIRRIRAAGGDVTVSHAGQSGVPFSRWLNSRYVSVYAGNRDADAVLQLAAELPHIDHLWIIESTATAEGLKHLRKYPSVGVLSVQKTPIRDEDLKHIAEMPALECFMFARTGNSPEALKKLGESMPGTQMLDANPLMDQQEQKLRGE